ncbi:MAG: hypothetical protein K6E89_05045 [Sphaerochaetaceae bacterium]|nr:hypothetical protein [Sphaerochaetaceae bacterium]
MKKAFVIILIAIVAATSAFAFKFNSIGIETGLGGFYVSADMDVVDNLDVYARIGYIGAFGFSAGAQYRVTDFKIDNTQVDFKPGAQFNFGFADKTFMFSMLATLQFSFETGHLSAFLRPGIGFGLTSYKIADDTRRTSTGFAWTVETGVAFLFK